MKQAQEINIEQNMETSINTRMIVSIAMVVIAFILAGVVFYFYSNKNNLPSSPQTSKIKEDIKTLVTKVDSLYELPKGEEPTVATVSDTTKLQNQPFFARAENGDKVLIYTNAKKAILYRPFTNKIIEVAPLNVNTPSLTPVTPSVAVSTHATVSIYNGTTTLGLAQDAEKKIVAAYPNLEIKEKMNALGDYAKTIVVDLKGDRKELVANIAKLLGGTISTLPKDEKKPDSDILIILGK